MVVSTAVSFIFVKVSVAPSRIVSSSDNNKLARASIVNPANIPRDQVAFGSTVKVKDLDLDDEEEFTLVGDGEEDYLAGKILVTSPLAQGMVGKKVGEQVEIEVPMGTTRFEILEIRFDD